MRGAEAISDRTTTAGPRARRLPADHPQLPPERVGVLLINLGTPDATDYWSMRRYLNEFLSDRRVIDYSPWFWQPLLQLVILTKRPFTSGAAYRKIWDRERNDSPLRIITRSQAEKLAARLQAAHPEVTVDWAMRYGNPSTPAVLERMVREGCTRILLMALYPQYASPTTATAYDRAFEALRSMKWQPAVRTLPPYHDHPLYIEVLAQSIRTHLEGLDFEPQKILFSYHGMPLRFLHEGDPYHCHCMKTTRLVKERLGLPDDRVMVVFQSRFGSEEWLQPYLDETLEALPGQGVRRIAVVSPAFVTDCVETLEEIAETGRESFLEAGGERFAYIPCLNDSDRHIDLLETLAREELAGWVGTARDG
jgi:ferrochelatase